MSVEPVGALFVMVRSAYRHVRAHCPKRKAKMLDVKIVLDAVPDYLFKACGAETQDERDTVAACVRTYARECISATLLTIEDGPIFKDAWRYRVMVENGAVPTQWHEIISEQREGYRARADAAFDEFVSDELSDLSA